MEKTINIAGVDVRLDNNMEWAYIYKDQFGHDIIPTLMPMLHAAAEVAKPFLVAGDTKATKEKIMQTLGDTDVLSDALWKLASLELVDVINITWAMAKTADESIEEPRRWVRQFDSFPMDIVGAEAVKLIIDGTVSTKNLQSLRSLLSLPKAKKTTTSTSTK